MLVGYFHCLDTFKQAYLEVLVPDCCQLSTQWDNHLFHMTRMRVRQNVRGVLPAQLDMGHHQVGDHLLHGLST